MNHLIHFVNNFMLLMDLLSRTRINNPIPKAVAISTYLSSIISGASKTQSSRTEITSAINPIKTILISFIRCWLKHYYRSIYVCKLEPGHRPTCTCYLVFQATCTHYWHNMRVKIEDTMYIRSLFGEKSLTGLSIPYNDPTITSSSGTTLNWVKIEIIVAKVAIEMCVSFRKENT